MHVRPLRVPAGISSDRAHQSECARRWKEVDDGIWLVSFMHYDLGYFDLEQKTLQPLDNPFGPKPVTHVSATTSAL
jgi:hypothetical protein